METNTEVNNKLSRVLDNLHTSTIFKPIFSEKESILFYDVSNTIFYDISNNIDTFSYKSQITIDYIGMCYSNYGNFPTIPGDYFYIFLFDSSPIKTDTMLIKPGSTNKLVKRKQTAIYQYLPCKTKSYLLYWCSNIPKYVEVNLHTKLKDTYPELVYITTKVNRKKDKEIKSNEIYTYHPNIMNESINFIKDYQSKNNLSQIELQEKTKQIEIKEKTKQFEIEIKEKEKTKQFEIEIKEKEKTKQFEIEIKEKTKQFEIEIKEKTKQFEIEIKEKEKTKQIKLQEQTKRLEVKLKYKCTHLD
jgi:hypothetical protein